MELELSHGFAPCRCGVASGFAMRLNSKGNIPASFSFFFLFIFFLSFFLLFFSFFFLRDFSRIAAVCIWSRRNNFRGWKIRVIWARLKWRNLCYSRGCFKAC